MSAVAIAALEEDSVMHSAQPIEVQCSAKTRSMTIAETSVRRSTEALRPTPLSPWTRHVINNVETLAAIRTVQVASRRVLVPGLVVQLAVNLGPCLPAVLRVPAGQGKVHWDHICTTLALSQEPRFATVAETLLAKAPVWSRFRLHLPSVVTLAEGPAVHLQIVHLHRLQRPRAIVQEQALVRQELVTSSKLGARVPTQPTWYRLLLLRSAPA